MKKELKDALVIGKKCFENSEYPRAEYYLQEAAREDDRFADVHNMLGLIYHEQGKFKLAEKEFDRALELNPNYTEASLNLALTCNDLGRYREGRLALEQAQARKSGKQAGLDPYLKNKLAQLYLEIADLYHSLGHYHSAVVEYKRALELCPDYEDIWNKLGCAYRDSGQSLKALEIFRQALERGHNYPALRLNLGVTYYSMGKTEDAVREWQIILRDNPHSERAKTYLKMVSKPISSSS